MVVVDPRPATTADAERIATLAEEIWREHYTAIIGTEQVEYMLARFQSAQAIREQIASGALDYRLLRAGGAAVGYLAVAPEDEALCLSKLYLLAAQRGQGLGRTALAWCAERARALDLARVRLRVNQRNTGAIDAYRACGFVLQSESCEDIGGGFVMDDLILELPLGPDDSRASPASDGAG